MKEWKLVLMLFAVFGCGTENNPEYHSGSTAEEREVWVCHNPQSELHGTICAEKINTIRGRYQPCFWVNHKRVKNSFCWLLEKKDCVDDLSFTWQKENCHLFGDVAE